MNSRVLCYYRVSTDAQAESGLGWQAQREACRAWGEQHGQLQLLGFSDEGVSGSAELASRPGLSALLGELRRGDVVLVAKRDRLARDVLLARLIEAAIIRKGARLVSAAGEGSGDTATDRLLSTIIDAFAEFERDQIRSRTKAALRVKKGRGERVGGVPFGYQLGADGKTLEVNLTEERTIIQARYLNQGGRSLRAIAAELYARGYRSRKGGPFEPQQIKRMLSE